MATIGEEDPFLQVQADVLATLETTRPLFQSYVRIRSLAQSPASHELAQARGELEQNLRDLAADVQDLVASVRAAEKDPFRYGLDVGEVARRRQLVDEVGRECEGMRAELAGAVGRAPAGGGVGGMGGDNGDDDDDDGYAQYEQERQMEIMQEQDEALDGVFKTVGNLREQADVMGRELEEQGEMIDEVDTLTERVGGKLAGGMKRLNTIIKKNEEKYSSCCIGVLIFVLVFLLILVIAL